MQMRGALIAVLAGLVLSQGIYGIAHGHGFEEPGGELTHACFVCETHAHEDLAPAPASGHGDFPTALRAGVLQHAPQPCGVTPRVRTGPRAPPSSISR